MGAKTGKKYKIDSRRWPGVYGYDSQGKGKDTCYYIVYRANDRLIWEKVGWKSEGLTPQIAAEIRSDRMRKARHGETVKTSKDIARERRLRDRTIKEIADAYFDSDRGKNLKGRTTDLNRYNNHIKPVLGKRTVSSLVPLDVERVKSSLKGKAPATVANTLELLRRIINFGTRNNLCPKLSFVIQLPERDNERTEYLKPDELKRLNKTLNEWKRQDIARMLKLAMVTGMRRGEIFNLQDTDLDFQHSNITIRQPKGGKTVSIPMNSLARQLLKDQIEWKQGRENYKDSPYVFPGRKGGRRVDCKAVDRIKEKAELPGKFRIFHGLRHHLAVTLANSGEYSLDMIAELLTHKSTTMTKRYGQFLPETVRQASNRAAELIMQEPSEESIDKPEAENG